MATSAPNNINAMLDVAIAAARAAGVHMKSQLNTSRVEKTKSSKDDLVTIVDKQCQDLVFDTIKETFPSHEFLGEENVAPGSEASVRALQDLVSKEWLWIVDPIDGTTNFVHHRPASVVSVACAHLGEVVVGVIYDPYRDEIFTAQKGKGTFLNGQLTHVSQEASISEALVGFGIGTKDSVRLPMLDFARELSAKCRGLRLQGAAAIELAWTAVGRQSAFYELDLNSWDIAAGALLVKEAGGHVTNSDGTPFSLSMRNIVASNNKGDIHSSMIELIAKADAVHVRKAKVVEQDYILINKVRLIVQPALPSLRSPYFIQLKEPSRLFYRPIVCLSEPDLIVIHLIMPQDHVNTWFFMCGPLAVNVFLLGLSVNLQAFNRYNLAFDQALDMKPDEVPTARGVFRTAIFLLFVQFFLFNAEIAKRGEAFGVDETRMEMLLLGYVLVAISLLLCPLNVLHYKFRMFVVRKLVRCLWPFQNFSLKLPTHATPFIEVFIADGMTSLSKFIQDLSVALMLLLMSLNSEPKDLKESYISKLKESPLPYFAASTPYIIRATQCLISFRRTNSVNDRFLHLLNTMKYCSSLLVISVGAYPMIMGMARPEHNSFFLLCAVFNSLYSFLWDVVMDWGLGQPKLPRRVAFLRHQLTYRPRKIYYLIIVVDFALRIMWVTKWWDWMHRGVHFKLFSQVAEVVRRIIWNFVRVEWQCIKLDILSSKKLSADNMELDGMIEKMPLMGGNEDDLFEDARTRMRTHPSSFSAENSTATSRTLGQSPRNGSKLHLKEMKNDDSAGVHDDGKAQRNEMIPVASYYGKPEAMLVSGRVHHLEF